jgi:hypothetical protein
MVSFLPTPQKGYACHCHLRKKLAPMLTLNGLERIVNLNYSLLSFLIRMEMSPTKTNWEDKPKRQAQMGPNRTFAKLNN